MTIVSIEKASSLVGKSSKTIYRHIQTGKLSRTAEGVDISELIRVYGFLKNNAENASTDVQMNSSTGSDEYSSLRREIDFLKAEIESLKEDKLLAHEREKKLFLIIESRLSAPDSKEYSSFMSSILKKWF